ncbi:hypothetical protein F5882DRAFT_491690 [Hyaloscypha sp. PMI_1271]|nr:hypothetical protein F5882DRAFT_491690 [Hyaloscypha sp. PMI_1271]
MASRRMRSRGCDQCRRRRVKCDETGDFCRQCLRFGLDCSGPVRGVTIVDMTPEAAFPLERAGTPLDRRPKKVRKTSVPFRTARATASSSSSSPSSSQSPPTSLDSSSPNEGQRVTAIIHKPHSSSGASSNSKVPMLYQPSTSNAIELFLVSQFLSFSRPHDTPALPIPWLMKIPEWMVTSQVPAFRFSIRAATTALHAKLHQSPAARVEAYRWYVITLNTFRAHLSAQIRNEMIEGNTKFVPGAEEIIIPTFLCLFETLANEETSLIAIVRGTLSEFANQDWRSIPFGEKGKALLHHLVDIMLCTPFYLIQAGHQGPMEHSILRIAKSDTLPPGLEQNYRRLLEQLENWWEAYESTPPEESEMLFTISDSTPKKYEKAEGVQYSPTLFRQRETNHALTASLYHATSLIVHTVLHALSIASERLGRPTSLPSRSKYHLKQANAHSNMIIEYSTQLQAEKPSRMEFLRPSTRFPLLVVKMLSPPEQSVKATNLLRQYHISIAMANKIGGSAGGENRLLPGPTHSAALHIAIMQNAAMQNR